MKATYWQKGETLDFTATEAVKNGQVVPLVSRIGVAGTDIPAGAKGQVHVVGVFELDKAAGEEMAMGTPVYYNATDDCVTTVASTGEGDAAVENIPAGYVAADAAKADTKVCVKLLG